MPTETGAPKQHKQPSRKGKRAWRKNVDITEVQDGLEALREEIIQTGSGPVAEQKSEDLFAIDVAGNESVRRKLKSTKPLKVDEILSKRSAIPGVDSRKRPASTGDGILDPASKRQKKDWVSKKEVQRLRQVAGTTSHLQGYQDEESSITNDLWADAAGPIDSQALEFIPKPKTKVAPLTLKQAPIAMTASGKTINPVHNPNAGTSYNPDFEQWNELLNREGEREIAAEKARLQKEAEQAERQARIDAIKETDGYRTDEESAWEGFETDRSETEQALKAKRPQRKTPAQRNKVNRRKEAERRAKHEARQATLQNRNLEIAKRNAEQGLDSAENLEAVELANEEDHRKLRRRRLGPAAIPEQNLELVLPDELQESLRQLKPEGNLLQDRFRTLLVNGKIESRKPVVQAKKKKVKLTEKWSYKDFGVSV